VTSATGQAQKPFSLEARRKEKQSSQRKSFKLIRLRLLTFFPLCLQRETARLLFLLA
jgi:hypothetical protein